METPSGGATMQSDRAGQQMVVPRHSVHDGQLPIDPEYSGSARPAGIMAVADDYGLGASSC